MIDSRTQLSVFWDDNGVFTDYTDSMADFIRDDADLAAFDSANDWIYLGFYKPFSSAYFHITAANTDTSAANTAEYYDGAAWQSLTIKDETKSFSRSGFIFWDKSVMNSVAINSTTKYWVRIKANVAVTALTFRAINVLFSDDNSLKQEFAEIDNSGLIPAGQTDHVLSHVSARNDILSHLRNIGYVKYNSTTGEENITPWDLHDIFEVRQASVYLTLSKIFFNLSDDVNDHWWAKYKEYEDKYKVAITVPKLSVDTDDDGVKDTAEKLEISKVVRWVK